MHNVISGFQPMEIGPPAGGLRFEPFLEEFFYFPLFLTGIISSCYSMKVFYSISLEFNLHWSVHVDGKYLHDSAPMREFTRFRNSEYFFISKFVELAQELGQSQLRPNFDGYDVVLEKRLRFLRP